MSKFEICLFFKSLCFSILFSLISLTASATIVERNAGGSWVDISAWEIGGSPCNCIPGALDTVILKSGITIVNSADVEIAGLLIESAASLYTQVLYSVEITGDYGLVNKGFFDLNSALSITTIANYPIENTGELDFDGFVNIYSDQRVYNTGTLDIRSNGKITLDSIQDIGIENTNGATINNAGEIISEVYTQSFAISNRGEITNSGSVKIKRAGSIAFFVGLGGTLTNTGTIEIDSILHNGMQNSGIITNANLISIKKVNEDGIRNYATFTNNGEIRIQNGGRDGIYGAGYFENNNLINIHSVADDGLDISDFVNNGILNISNNIGSFGINVDGGTFTNNQEINIGGVASFGINNTDGASFSNSGTIKIDTSAGNGLVNDNSNFNNLSNGEITISNVGLYALRNTGTANFDNMGLLLLNDDDITYSIFNESTFVNSKCGNISCYDAIYNDVTFLNLSYLFQECSSANFNSGTMNNNGVISDVNDSFNGVLSGNSGVKIITIPGNHCEGDVIPMLYEGMRTGMLFRTTIYTDSLLSTSAGTYDIGANSWTPTAAAGLKDSFFMEIDLTSGCIVTVSIRLENIITPLWYLDNDGDLYGDTNFSSCSLTQPTGYVINPGDCVDSDNTIYPGAPEICDGIDNDCSGSAETLVIIWTGSGDGTYWSDANNWDGLNVPASCQLVEVPASFAPIIDAGPSAVAMQVKVFATASLSLAANATLNINGTNNYTTLINEGNFTNNGKVNLINTLGDGIFNQGYFQNIDTISISNASESAIENTGNGVIDNEGFIDIFGNFPSSVIHNVGEITNGPNGKISLKNNPSKSTGIYNTSISGSPGKITSNGEILLDGVHYGIQQSMTTNPIVNASQGIIRISNSFESGISGGNIDNNGSIEIHNSGNYGIDDGGLTNAGSVLINQTASSGILLKGISNNSGTIEITNTNIGLEFSNTFYQNTGTISIDTTVNEGMIIDLTSTFDNKGKLELHNANQTGIILQGNLNNSDSIIVSDNIIGNGILIDGGVYDNSSTAYLEVKNTDLNCIYLGSGDFINAGKVVVNNAVGDGINTGGGTLVDNVGEFQIRAGIQGYGINGTSIQFNNKPGGSVSGNGLILSAVFNDQGNISPGESPGKIILDGNYSQVNSTYFSEISGLNGEGVMGGHDIIESNAHILLGGNLDVKFISGFTPCPGDEWILMKSTAPITGTFASTLIPSGYCLSLIYDSHNIRLAMPGPPTSNWNGTVSDDWFDANNWNEGCVPGPESDVFIQTSPRYPKVGGKNALAKSVYLNSGTFLDIKTGFKLNIVKN